MNDRGHEEYFRKPVEGLGENFKAQMVDEMLALVGKMSRRRISDRAYHNFGDITGVDSDYSKELVAGLPLTHTLKAVPVEQDIQNRYTGGGWKAGLKRHYEKIGSDSRIVRLKGGEMVELSRCESREQQVIYDERGAKPRLGEDYGIENNLVMKIRTHNSKGELIDLPRVCFYGLSMKNYDLIDEDYIPGREEWARKEIERFMVLFKPSDIVQDLLPEQTHSED